MIIDYLNRLEALEVDNLKREEREELLTVLGYLERRASNPKMLEEIHFQTQRLMPKNTTKQPRYAGTTK